MKNPLQAIASIVESNAGKKVQGDDLRGWVFFAAIKIGTIICVPMFAFGGLLGRHAQFSVLVPSVFAGAAIVSVLMMVTSYVGMRARVPTAVLTRRTFGTSGATVLALMLIVSLFGWFGLQTEVLARALVGLLQDQFHITLSTKLVVVVTGALMSSTAIVGFRALGRVVYVAVPLLLVLISVPLWVAFGKFDVAARLAAPPPESAYTPGMIISLVASGFMLAISVAPDISRFMRTTRDVVLGPAVGIGLALPLVCLLSSALAIIYQNGDLVAVMRMAGIGVPTVFVLLLATWTSNDKNLYEAALSLSALFPKIARWKLAIVAATLGISLGVIGIFGYFMQVLVYLGLVIAPAAGAYVVDFILDPDGYVTGENIPKVRVTPFAAWIIGIACGLATLPADTGGFGLFQITTAPTLDAMLSSAAIYAVLRLIQRRYARRTAALAQTGGV